MKTLPVAEDDLDFDDNVIPAGVTGLLNDRGVGGKSSGQETLVQSMVIPLRAVISICLIRS